jgi:hypothetical protein
MTAAMLQKLARPDELLHFSLAISLINLKCFQNPLDKLAVHITAKNYLEL